MTLEDYFKLIVKPTETKETTMMLKLSMFFTQLLERCAEKINSLLTKPVAFVETEAPKLHDDGYWAFEMYTPEWVDEHGETVKPIHTVVIEPHEGTWMDVVDRILDEMEKHYGYSIKEQVYYSVNFPHNEPSPHTGELMAGHGRCLNDERLQQILLAFPELYESRPWINDSTEEAMFK